MPEKPDSAKTIASVSIRKYGLGVLLVVLAIGVLGFLVVPPLVKTMLVEQLSEALHRPVTVEGVSINPYRLSVQVVGVAIQEKSGGEKVAGFDSLYVNLESSSVFRGGPVISELRLAGPSLKLVRLADGRFNFSDLIDEFVHRPESKDPTPPFSLHNIQITGGKFEFDDQAVGEKHLISEVNIALPFVSSLPSSTEIFVEPAFSASIDGSPLLIQGKSKPFANSLESNLAFDLHDVQLGRYVDYAPLRLPIQVVSGVLDSDLKLVFRREKGEGPTLTLSGGVALRDLTVKDSSGAPLFSLKRLEVLLGSLDPFNRSFVIDRVAVDSPEMHARVSRQGAINWVEFFSRESTAHGAVTTEVKEKSPPVAWSLGEAKVTGGAVHWLDESHGAPFNASIEGLELDLKGLDSKGTAPAEFDAAWRLQAAPWIKVDGFSVKGGRLDLAKREVLIDEAASRGARSLFRRAVNGSIEFVQPPLLRVAEAAQKDPAAPWKVTIARYHVEDFGLRFEDGAVSPAVTHTIDGGSVDAENLSTEPGRTARVATRFRVNRKGEVEASGSVKAFPLEADLKVAARTMELLPLQPYFTERLNVDIVRGQVTLAGALQVGQAPSAVADGAKLTGGFSGQVTVGDLQAVDKINSADLVKWKSLYLGKFDARLNPDSLSIGEVALADFFARVIISREGKLNLLQIVRQAEPAPAAAAPKVAPAPATTVAEGKATAPTAASSKPPSLPVRIAKITLQGGDIKFSDNFVKPNYSANLKKIGGTISGLSSAADSVASLDLRGSYDNIAPLTISGQINPLSPTPYLDLQAEMKGIEMTSLSPYSGKYAGYAIEKGKLSLFVKYKIENNQLTAENRVFLDQLTFGRPVDSPDATKLPVTLAAALLKNRNGEIDINLPIAGSLSDPEFSVGGLVVKVIVNLLVKAVTSPFALLGAVFGGGEELSNVEFDAGQAAITQPAQQRLENLAKALLDRPALRLEIEGRADPDNDPEGLKRDRLDQKVRARKARDLADKGATGAVEISATEYPELLERVYRAEKFPKPRNLVGMVKGLPVEDMEKLILANSAVDEEDLRDLADRRASAVRDWLVAHGLPPERLFVLPVQILASDGKPESPQQAKGSRVALSLK